LPYGGFPEFGIPKNGLFIIIMENAILKKKKTDV
jgi:hypothetical protein